MIVTFLQGKKYFKMVDRKFVFKIIQIFMIQIDLASLNENKNSEEDIFDNVPYSLCPFISL